MKTYTRIILFLFLSVMLIQLASAAIVPVTGPVDVQTDLNCDATIQAMTRVTTMKASNFYTIANVTCEQWKAPSSTVILTKNILTAATYDCGQNAILTGLTQNLGAKYNLKTYSCADLPAGFTNTNRQSFTVPEHGRASCPSGQAIVGITTKILKSKPRIDKIICGNIDDGITAQCNDRIDNDNDGIIDYPNDPGCSSPTDNDETNNPICGNSRIEGNEQCDDGNTNNNDACSNNCQVTCLNGQFTMPLISDTNTFANSNPSVATYNQHPFWTANIPGAMWIWKEVFVSNPLISTSTSFLRPFSMPSFATAITSASITIAADNTYTCRMNNNQFGQDLNEVNYRISTQDAYTITNLLNLGQNALSCTVTNLPLANSNAYLNPAGLLYKMQVSGTCSTECRDGINNDNDSQIDFPPDMGCDNPDDPTEDPNPICGNAILERGEQCDDGNTANGDGCSSLCRITPPSCGNGIINQGEQCDDGNRASGDGCSISCQNEQNPLPACGNSILERYEACDDGNLANGDGCSNFCDVTKQCSDGVDNDGDGQTDYPADLGCDNPDDNTENPNPVCGNTLIERGETCDDGNTNNGDGCSSTCQIQAPFVCGNGIIEGAEQCDDGNTNNNDGCSSTCQIQSQFVCGNGIIEGTEQCDDANNINGDGCSASCLITTQCNDQVDNDGDGNIDMNDPGCSTPSDNSESPDPVCPTQTCPVNFVCNTNTNTCRLPQCRDGIDNDGDGRIDYPADIGCSSLNDDDETNSPVPQPTNTGSTKRHTRDSSQDDFNNIIIEDFKLGKEAYNCDEKILASIVVKNNGDYDANNVFVRLGSNNLGIDEESERITLNEGQRQIIQQMLSIPEGADNGDYIIAATLVKGIDLSTEASKISLINCGQDEQYSIALQSYAENYTPEYSEDELFNGISTPTIMIALLVLILAIAYLMMLLL